MRRFETVPGRHAELVVLLGISGQAQYLLDGDLLPLGRGRLIWALSGQAHMLISESAGFDMWVGLFHPHLWDGERSACPPLSITERAPFGLRHLDARPLAEL